MTLSTRRGFFSFANTALFSCYGRYTSSMSGEGNERLWTAGLGAGLVLVGLLTLWPLLFAQPRAPQVMRQELPAVTMTDPAPEYPSTASVEPLISGQLNLNSATQEQLEALPRIGPALAERIMAARPLGSLADLDAVSGIGPATLEELAPLVTF